METAEPLSVSSGLTCPECGRTGFKNQYALGVHRRLGHGIRTDGTITQPRRRKGTRTKEDIREYSRLYRARKKAERLAEMHGGKVVVREKKAQSHEVRAHFCPNCGTNIDAVQMALKMTSH